MIRKGQVYNGNSLQHSGFQLKFIGNSNWRGEIDAESLSALKQEEREDKYLYVLVKKRRKYLVEDMGNDNYKIIRRLRGA